MNSVSGPESDREASRVPANSFRRHAGVLIQKELRETLRDRRTIVTLLAMPCLLYPLLGLLFRFVAVGQAKDDNGPEFTISVPTAAEAVWLNSALETGDAILRENWPGRAEAIEGLRTGSASKTGGESETQSDSEPSPPSVAEMVKLLEPGAGAPSLAEIVATQEADIAVTVELGERPSPNDILGGRVSIISCPDLRRSQDAARYVEDRLQATNLLSVLNQVRLREPRTKIPILTEFESVRSNQKSRGFLGLLPLVLLLMTVTGGVYPAIDLTAGERERDTLETLVALPIPKVHLLFAKYIAVLTVTLLTGIVNAIGMSATVYALQMENQLFGEAGLSLQLFLSLIVVLTVFALFYSAVLLAITSSSRSFKEAQAYLIPLMLMSLSPGLVVLLPGWRLEGFLAVIPLVNMLLLAGDLFSGSAQLLPAAAAVLSTLLYAAGALALAARLFGNDAVASGSRGTWSDLFRRPDTEQLSVRPGLAATGLALLFPLYFFGMGILNRLAGSAPEQRLVAGALVTLLLFAILPAVLCFWQRVSIRTAWRIRSVPVWIWPTAVLLGVSAWPLIYELVLATRSFGLTNLSDERLKQVATILERWKQVPVPLMVMTLGVVTGFSEEVFFRGFLLSGLRTSLKPWPAAIVCGVIFGAFHVIAADGATLERFLPSTTLGILLSWIAVRTGSLLPGMIVHICHNSALLLLASYQGQLSQLLVAQPDQEHLPTLWLVGSAVAVLSAIAGIWKLSQDDA